MVGDVGEAVIAATQLKLATIIAPVTAIVVTATRSVFRPTLVLRTVLLGHRRPQGGISLGTLAFTLKAMTNAVA